MNSQQSFESATLPMLDSLYRIALCMVHDPAEAEHCVSQTYSQASRSFHHLREGDKLRQWMFGQLFRIIRQRPKKWFGRWLRASDPAVSVHQDGMTRALLNIPAELREVILLADVERFYTSEIAATLGLDGEVVAERLAEARAKLRSELSEEQNWAASLLKRSEAM
jgi:DNA-directed RNA polymerase specialized sigma24 family protein